jgi:prefoldin beta subunit
MSNFVSARQQLEAQFQENKIVKEEFGILQDDAKIYKLIGPVLIPQDKAEADLNVEKRLEFINSEMYDR